MNPIKNILILVLLAGCLSSCQTTKFVFKKNKSPFGVVVEVKPKEVAEKTFQIEKKKTPVVQFDENWTEYDYYYAKKCKEYDIKYNILARRLYESGQTHLIPYYDPPRFDLEEKQKIENKYAFKEFPR